MKVKQIIISLLSLSVLLTGCSTSENKNSCTPSASGNETHTVVVITSYSIHYTKLYDLLALSLLRMLFLFKLSK